MGTFRRQFIFAIITVVCGLFFASNVHAAAQWVNDPTDCVHTYDGVNCAADIVCGYNSVACYNPASISAPAGTANSVTQYSGSFGAGYIMNCLADRDSAAPYCDNNTAMWCNASTTCSGYYRYTTCAASKWSGDAGAATCGTCQSGYNDCNADGLTCEIHDGADCTTGGGIPGHYLGCSGLVGNCIPDPQHFITGIKAEFSTSSPLLWGNQIGAGDLLKLTTNNAATTSIVVNNIGHVGIGTTTPLASAALDIYSTDSGVLLPRLTNAQRGAIATLTEGLLIYNSDSHQFEYYSTSSWSPLGAGGGFVDTDTTTSPAGNNGEVQFNDSGIFGATSTFIWDNSNARLSIATSASEFALNIGGDGGIFAGVAGLGDDSEGTVLSVSGTGTRMIWYPRKGAFRAGSVGVDDQKGDTWDEANIGGHSAAFGGNNIARSKYSFAAGEGNTVDSGFGYAFGVNNIVEGASDGPGALGAGNYVRGDDGSVAIGYWNVVDTSGNNQAMAFGYHNTSTGYWSYSMGTYMDVSGQHAFGINVSTTPATLTQNNTIALMGGNVGIGTTTPGYSLTVSGDTNLTGALRANGNAGANGQILQTTGSGLTWISTTSLGFVDTTTSPAGSNGQIQFNNNGVFGASSALYWDNTNARIGVGTTTPTSKISIVTNNLLDGLRVYSDSLPLAGIGSHFSVSGAGDMFLFDQGVQKVRMTASGTSYVINNFTIGQYTGTELFNVGTGTSRLQVNAGGDLIAIKGASYSWPTGYGGTATLLLNDGAGNLSWVSTSSLGVAGASSSPGGPSNAVQFNNSGVFGGTSTFTWDSTNGRLGVGTSSPEFKLTIAGDGGIIATGESYTGTTLTTSGAGTRMIWYPRKAAFRAGEVTGASWDDANIGDYSVAFGLDTTSSGYASFALGEESVASGDYSFAGGYYGTEASGDVSFAFGHGALASGYGSVAFGQWSQATGTESFARGANAVASDDYAIAMGMNSLASNNGAIAIGGDDATASGINSVALGYGSTASGQYSIALGGGGATASGNTATAFGTNATASGTQSTAFGVSTVAGGTNSIAFGESITVTGADSIGINVSSTSATLSQANTIALMGGNVGVGTTTPGYKLTVLGDINLAGALRTNGNAGTYGQLLMSTGTGAIWMNTSSLGLGAGSLTGSGTSTQVAFWSGTNSLSSSSSLYWDNINGRLGVNAAVPTEELDVNGDINISASSTYRYNGQLFAMASTTLLNYFSGGAGNLTMTGANNTAMGYQSLDGVTTGGNNSAFGMLALTQNSTGGNNTANGYYALGTNTGGSDNTASGYEALRANLGGRQNAAIGSGASRLNTSGSGNVAIGYNTLYTATVATSNTAAGWGALYSFNNNAGATAFGYRALYNLASQGGNSAFGYEALANVTGAGNTAVGSSALTGAIGSTAWFNVAIGMDTLVGITSGLGNIGIGVRSLNQQTTGNYNIAIGHEALRYNNSTANTAVGAFSIGSSGAGATNTAIGYEALYSRSSGSLNTAIGALALRANTTGNYNVGLGFQAGSNITTGGYNIIIGSLISAPSTTKNYQLNIGDAIYGDLQAGYVGIGTTSPAYKLTVAGDFAVTGTIRVGDTMASGTYGQLLMSTGTSSQWMSTTSLGFASSSGSNNYIQNQNASDQVAGFRVSGVGTMSTTTIGTSTAEFKLTIAGDGGIIATGVSGSGATLTTAGAGTRMIWYPRKGAFRAGEVDDTQWDNANIGDYSVAFGYNTAASGTYSAAFGDSTTAGAYGSAAFGSYTVASGYDSVAFGDSSEATDDGAFAAGLTARAYGSASVALGAGPLASGVNSVALGNNTTASGDQSTAFGYYTVASKQYATAFGYYTTASGTFSTAVGRNLTVSGDNSFGLNVSSTAATVSQANTIALLGGNVGVGTTTPGYRLTVSGDTNLTGALRANGNAGTSGQILQTIGSGIQWVSTSSLGLASSTHTHAALTNGTGIAAFSYNGSTATSVTLAASGVTAATYGAANQAVVLAVDTYGRITSASTSSIAIAASQITSGVFGVTYGGTGSSTIGSAGSVAYSNGTNYAFTAVGSSGQILQSNGAGTPTWISTSSLGFASSSGSNNYIQNQNSTDQSASFRISGTGTLAAVGIGVTNPAKSLDVNGSAIFNKQCSGSADCGTGGVCSGGYCIAGSEMSKIGVGTTAPEFSLSMAVDGGIIAKGTYGSGTTLTTSGAGSRMIWYPRQSAFRAGAVGVITNSDAWDDVNIGAGSVAFGMDNYASGTLAVAFGIRNNASGVLSFIGGQSSSVSATGSFAYGNQLSVTGQYSVAFGASNIVSGNRSGVFGESNIVSGNRSGAFGQSNIVSGDHSFAVGNNNTSSADNSFTAGLGNTASGVNSFAGGMNSTAGNIVSFAYGNNAHAMGSTSVAFGMDTMVSGDAAFAYGTQSTTASGASAFAGGVGSIASGTAAFAGGTFSIANGITSFAFGNSAYAGGDNAAAFGMMTRATGGGSLAYGVQTSTAAGDASFAGGVGSVASGVASFAGGTFSIAGGTASVAYGSSNYASGTASIALGSNVTTTKDFSIAMGSNLIVSGTSSFGLNVGGAITTVSQPNVIALLGGNVGIGTTTPATTLSVAGTATMQDVIPAGPYTGNMSAYNLGASATRWNSIWVGTANIGTSTWSLTASTSNGRLGLFDQASGAGIERMSVLTSGYIGIGTTTPGNQLVVQGSGNILKIYAPNTTLTAAIQTENHGMVGEFGSWSGGSSNGPYIYYGSSSTDPVAIRVGGSPKIYIASSTGYVGVGVTSPQERLEIAGNFRIPLTTATTGIIYQNAYRYIHSYGTGNFFAGREAGGLSGSADYNVGIGEGAAETLSAGDRNVVVGYYAGNLLGGSDNVGVGYYALNGITNADDTANVAVGSYAMYDSVNAASNTAMGYRALQQQNAGDANVAIGYYALSTSVQGSSTAVGYDAARNAVSAIGLTALGYRAAGVNGVTGDFDTAVGFEALRQLSTGSYNTAVGYQAGASGSSAAANTLIGSSAGFNNSGTGNTVLGASAGTTITTQDYHVVIGNMADITSNALINGVAIGYNAIVGHSNSVALGANSYTSRSNSVILGDPDASVYVGIGVSYPSSTLHMDGGDLYIDAGGICVADATGECAGHNPGAGTIIADGTITANSWDLAERFKSDEALEAGDVVTYDPINAEQVVLTSAPYQLTFGVVSEDPAFIMGFEEPGYYPVALAGRVPVKVTDANGPIGKGDKLVASALPGYAMKATEEGPYLGIAIDDFSGPGTGTVKAYIDSGLNYQLYRGLSVNDDGSILSVKASTIAFNAAASFESSVSNFSNARAFTFNALNFNTSTSDNYLLSLRSNNSPVFSVSANGDVHSLGNMYAASAVLGTSTNPGDLAEKVDINPSETVEAGDVMMVDPTTPDRYQKVNTSYEPTVAGVISTNPTIIVGNGKTSQTAPLAMVGRVPVKYSEENGPIQRGDLLVAASIPGQAMKYDPKNDNSRKVVGIVGIALDSSSNSTDGKILTLIRTGWVYNKTEAAAKLEAQVQVIANETGIDIGSVEAEDLSVGGSSGGTISYSGEGNLDLANNAILNVSAIIGKNNKWTIDENGLLTAKITTSQGEKSVYGLSSESAELQLSGSATLVNGEVQIIFATDTQEIIDGSAPIKVIPALTSGECQGIYVSEKSAQGFTVKELNSGTSSSTFDWIVIAKRKIDNSGSTALEQPESQSEDNSDAWLEPTSSDETTPPTVADESTSSDDGTVESPATDGGVVPEPPADIIPTDAPSDIPPVETPPVVTETPVEPPAETTPPVETPTTP